MGVTAPLSAAAAAGKRENTNVKAKSRDTLFFFIMIFLSCCIWIRQNGGAGVTLPIIFRRLLQTYHR